MKVIVDLTEEDIYLLLSKLYGEEGPKSFKEWTFVSDSGEQVLIEFVNTEELTKDLGKLKEK